MADAEVIQFPGTVRQEPEVAEYQCECGSVEWAIYENGDIHCARCGEQAAMTAVPDR